MRLIFQPCARAVPAFRKYLLRSVGTLSSPELNDRLRRHIDKAGEDPKASFVPVLEQWKQQGNQLNPSDVRLIVENLRDSKRFPQALKVSEWMSDQKVCDLVPEDFAARLHLIDKILGLNAAEKFFKSIPENKRDDFVYTTMLSFYARLDETESTLWKMKEIGYRSKPHIFKHMMSSKTLAKAESIFGKMTELRYLSKPSPFNHMMSLYISLGKLDMVHEILSQMKENNVEPDKITLNNKLRLYAAESKIKEMLKLLAKCDTNTFDWRTCSDIAKAYLRQGSVVEAVNMLRRAEESLVDPESKKLAYKSLMRLYGEAGKAEDVSRIWESDYFEKWEEDYRLVLYILLKLNHNNEAGKIYNSWIPPIKHDVRIVAMMASAYCERGQLKDAEDAMFTGVVRPALDNVLQLALLALVVVLCKLVVLVKFILKMAFDAITTSI
ncbi:PREDICTED: putative pentatricopeptide repeat-containing protein At1g28020 [Camelina sativa]|uniref:Pentatricopeptide repeat-containing protein At1g28020 n=1 Tax=Camelina sativa TaxID=90675 RepID=A0ABM0WYW6_CAMSA|nr:PREDICTED: putative pentatricopeptide repeat-containing protein At1g28020 [Camelina sativa]